MLRLLPVLVCLLVCLRLAAIDLAALHGESRIDFDLRPYATWMDADDTLNDGRFGGTDSHTAWRAGVRSIWTVPGAARSPVAFLVGIDAGYEYRTMTGVFDRRPHPESWLDQFYDDTGMPVIPGWVPPMWMIGYELQRRPERQLSQLSVIDTELMLGIQGRLARDGSLLMDAWVHGGPGFGTLGGWSYVGGRWGGTVGLGWRPWRHLYLGGDVGFSWSAGRARPDGSSNRSDTELAGLDADYRGNALEVSAVIGACF